MHLTITTLADLDRELALHAYCKACHRMETLDKDGLECYRRRENVVNQPI